MFYASFYLVIPLSNLLFLSETLFTVFNLIVVFLTSFLYFFSILEVLFWFKPPISLFYFYFFIIDLYLLNHSKLDYLYNTVF